MFGRDPADHTQPVFTARQHSQGGHRGMELHLPETAVMFFMGRGMEVAQSYSHHILTEKFPRFLRQCPIGQFDVGNGACFIHGGSGAPMAADTLETLHACGVRRVVMLGMCGVYRRDINVGEVIVPPFALVEEGTSLHYESGVGRGYPSQRLCSALQAHYEGCRPLPIVSTDAVFRQTYFKEAQWRGEGCVGVDMETSAVFCVGKYLGMEVAAALIASDKHPEEENAPTWNWSITQEMRDGFLHKGIEFALTK